MNQAVGSSFFAFNKMLLKIDYQIPDLLQENKDGNIFLFII